MNTKQIILAMIYLAGRAFGWCLVSFCLLWALLAGDDSIAYLWYDGIIGVLLIIISEIALSKLKDEQ
jgi:hypothetical protein